MKRMLFAVFAALTFVCFAQNREDSPVPELSFKSQSIKKALYWEQKNGKWESRKHNKLVYSGEGVDVENFETLFLGVLSGHRYLFLDKYDFFWRYPVTQVEWSRVRTMHMVLLSDSDWDALKEIGIEKDVIVSPRFWHSMSKAHNEYSFPFFIELGNTKLSSQEVMYNSYLNHEGKDAAEDYWRKESPQTPFITAKRVISKVGDVVRFRFGAVTELIDNCYFEVSYSEWQKLFVADKSNSYK